MLPGELPKQARPCPPGLEPRVARAWIGGYSPAGYAFCGATREPHAQDLAGRLGWWGGKKGQVRSTDPKQALQVQN